MYQQILNKAFSLFEIHEIIEYISNMLKKPVILEDDQFHLLSYSSYYINDFDHANQQTILSKKSPLPILERFIEDGIIDQLKTINGPFRVNKIDEIGLNHRVVVSTQFKKSIMGYLWIQEIENPLTEEEIDFVHQVSAHIGKILYKKNQARREKNEKKGQFYREIIKLPSKHDKQLKQEADVLHIMIPSSLKAIVFTLANPEEDFFENLKETVQSYLNVMDCMTELLIDSSAIIVILGEASRQNQLDEQALDLVTRIIKSYDQQYATKVFAGIGNTYSQLSMLRKSYVEALETIKSADFIGDQNQMPLEYRKLGVFRYIEVIGNHNKEIQYVNPELLKLKQKDKENQTELLKTLEAYLMNNCKSKQTAEQLFIHPNTLNYRIKQILEYTNIDLTDFNMNCQLYIDLLVMKHDERG